MNNYHRGLYSSEEKNQRIVVLAKQSGNCCFCLCVYLVRRSLINCHFHHVLRLFLDIFVSLASEAHQKSLVVVVVLAENCWKVKFSVKLARFLYEFLYAITGLQFQKIQYMVKQWDKKWEMSFAEAIKKRREPANLSNLSQKLF